jgi:hypothetical protein
MQKIKAFCIFVESFTPPDPADPAPIFFGKLFALHHNLLYRDFGIRILIKRSELVSMKYTLRYSTIIKIGDSY